jgi:hypothetical protein
MKKLPPHRNDAEPQISIFSHDQRLRGANSDSSSPETRNLTEFTYFMFAATSLIAATMLL